MSSVMAPPEKTNQSKSRNQCRKIAAKPIQPAPDLRLSFLGPGETEKPGPEKMGLSNAFADRGRSEPRNLVKRKARPELGQRKKPKKQRMRRTGGVIIDLAASDNEDGVAASTEALTEDQAKANDHTSVDVDMTEGNDVVSPVFDQQTPKQAHAGGSGNNKPEPSEEEIQRLLWRLVVRAKEKEAAELKTRNEKNAREGRPLEQAAPDDWTDSDEDEEVPWSLDEDEELARWKLGGFSDEQLDWPTFHESRTWEDLMTRLTWLETKHPKCWAALKEIEDQEQELFERELSVEIEEMKAKGLLPSSSDEMSDDESAEGSVKVLDGEANLE